MHFARVAGENLVSPDEKATGLGVFVFLALPRGLRLRRAGRRLGQAHRRADRQHSRARRRGARERRRRAHQGQERPRGGRRADGRPNVRRERRRHRRDRTRTISAGWSTASRRKSSKAAKRHADLRDRLHHRARRAERAAQVPSRRARARGDDRAAAEQVRHDPQIVRSPALRRIFDATRSSASAR